MDVSGTNSAKTRSQPDLPFDVGTATGIYTIVARAASCVISTIEIRPSDAAEAGLDDQRKTAALLGLHFDQLGDKLGQRGGLTEEDPSTPQSSRDWFGKVRRSVGGLDRLAWRVQRSAESSTSPGGKEGRNSTWPGGREFDSADTNHTLVAYDMRTKIVV